MNFGEAIELARQGKQIQRAGWNGKNQYVELATNISYKNAKGYVINVNHDAIGNSAFAFVGTSGVQLGWLASQADMLATDWQVVDDGPYSFQEIVKLANEFDYDDCLAKKKFPLFTRKVCLRCNGKGILYSLYSVRRCPVCDGTGNYNTNCKSYTRRRKNQINDKGGSPMDFSEALKKVKEGKKIYRSNWNGPNQFVVYQKGYPDGIPCNKQTAEAWGMKEGDLFKCRPYLQIQCTDGSHQMWAPSVSDVLEEDWYIIPDTTDDVTVTTKEEPASQTSLQDISIKEIVDTNIFVLNAKAIRDIVYENNISVQEAAERYAVAENWTDGSTPALREFIYLCKRFSIEGLAYMVDEYLQSRGI